MTSPPGFGFSEHDRRGLSGNVEMEDWERANLPGEPPGRRGFL